jgi:hypothetical protein
MLLYIPQLFGISIEVYFIIFFLGIPVFFFWRRIFKNKVSGDKQRRLVVWLSTILTAPLLYGALALLVFFFVSYNPKDDFNRKEWFADKESRFKMSGDIIDSKMLIGKTKAQIKSLLGDEGNSDADDDWHYYLGYVPDIGNIDPDLLDITFKKGRVVEVRQHNS